MKTIYLILILIGVASGKIMAQDTPVDKLFDKYANKDGFTTVFVSKEMFSLFADQQKGERSQDQFQDAISGLESIKVLTVEDSALNRQINFFDEIGDQIPFGEYKTLLTVKEKNQELRMMVKEQDGKIAEFLMLSGGDDNVLISIIGQIDLKAISNISKAMDVEGLENLKDME